jgi:hypothetical protein
MSATDNTFESTNDEADKTDLIKPETIVLSETKDEAAPANGLDAKPTKYAWSVLWTIFAVRAIHQLHR